MLKSITQVNQNDKQISKTVKRFFIMQEISRSDISGITTKAPCEVALIGERHVRIEISDFVMRTFVPFMFLCFSAPLGLSSRLLQ